MNLKEIKQRIQSVKNTQKITSAMKLVSAAKLRRSQGAIDGMLPYSHKLDEFLALSLNNTASANIPLTAEREVKKVIIVAVASDTGLCGTFNANIVRKAKERAEYYISTNVEVEIIAIGRKMYDSMKKHGFMVHESAMKNVKTLEYMPVNAVATTLMQRFLSGEADRVELVFTHSLSASRQQPVYEQLLPVLLSQETDLEQQHATEFIIEPSREELLVSLLPKVVSLHLYTSLLDSAVAEHSARMIAMQAATENANDLIAELTLEYNKGRQQAITNEILDIVSGTANS